MTQIDFVIAVVLTLTIVVFVTVFVSSNFSNQFQNLKVNELENSAATLEKQLFDINDSNSLVSEYKLIKVTFNETSGTSHPELVNLSITPSISNVHVYDRLFNEIPSDVVSTGSQTNVSFSLIFMSYEKKQVNLVYNSSSSVTQIARYPTAVSSSQTQNVIVRPTAIQNFNQWTLGAGSNKVSAVNEPVSDGDTSYITTSSNNIVQSYNVTGAGIPTSTTNIYVELHYVARKTVSQPAQITGVMTWGASQSEGPLQTLTTSYQEFTRNMTTNPQTGSSWTVSDVNNWVSGNNIYAFGVKSKNARNMRVTQIYIKVGYVTTTSATSENTTQKMLSDQKIFVVSQNKCNNLNGLSYDSARDIYGFKDQFNINMTDCLYGANPPVSANIIARSIPVLVERTGGSITFSTARLLVW